MCARVCVCVTSDLLAVDAEGALQEGIFSAEERFCNFLRGRAPEG